MGKLKWSRGTRWKPNRGGKKQPSRFINKLLATARAATKLGRAAYRAGSRGMALRALTVAKRAFRLARLAAYVRAQQQSLARAGRALRAQANAQKVARKRRAQWYRRRSVANARRRWSANRGWSATPRWNGNRSWSATRPWNARRRWNANRSWSATPRWNGSRSWTASPAVARSVWQKRGPVNLGQRPYATRAWA